eukprot:8544362-Pyramimonas_sp.AAC.1
MIHPQKGLDHARFVDHVSLGYDEGYAHSACSAESSEYVSQGDSMIKSGSPGGKQGVAPVRQLTCYFSTALVSRA